MAAKQLTKMRKTFGADIEEGTKPKNGAAKGGRKL